jgi:epoxyqueuosine reductase QueG
VTLATVLFWARWRLGEPIIVRQCQVCSVCRPCCPGQYILSSAVLC